MTKENRTGRGRGIRSSTPVSVRLAARLDRSDPEICWPYKGGANTRSGHRQIWDRGTMKLAHRVAWELANGSIPEGLCVLHRCDNPPCCNPAHLFLGTQADNNADRDQKGRHVALSGEDHGSAQLTDEQVRAIIELADADVPQSLIARAAGISPSQVSLIARGQSRSRAAAGAPIVDVPALHRAALDKVTWPELAVTG